MCSSIWNLDRDPTTSVRKLITEQDQFSIFEYSTDNLRGIGFYIEQTINLLASAQELSIDATYGTTSNGEDLVAVMAEFDGTGTPLAYCFVRRLQSATGGQMIELLAHFLRGLKQRGLEPEFFGCDKDFSEIGAIQYTWPSVKVQLCFWHVRRAIRTRLSSSAKSACGQYNVLAAISLIPDLEPCWGSISTQRPHGHRYGQCLCPSKARLYDAKVRIEPCKEEMEIIVNMLSRHFNMHATIPGPDGELSSAETIHQQASREVYQSCRNRNYPVLWVYLFTNWYAPAMWNFWSRAGHPSQIPVLKTTMILESHWRVIKHDFLHRFSRPRLDLVAHVLISRVVPRALVKLQGIMRGGQRAPQACWRKAFKREWRNLEKKVPGHGEDPTGK